MAGFLEWLIQGSDQHKVQSITGGYTIMPLETSIIPGITAAANIVPADRDRLPAN